MKDLKLLTDPELLCHVHRNIIERFLEDMKQCRPANGLAFLDRDVSPQDFCSGLATLFRSLEGVGAPLVQALCDIDTLALPENRP